MRSHWLSVNKHSRHTWCIKTCKQSVYHNYQIQLFSSALKSGIFSGKTFIQIVDNEQPVVVVADEAVSGSIEPQKQRSTVGTGKKKK